MIYLLYLIINIIIVTEITASFFLGTVLLKLIQGRFFIKLFGDSSTNCGYLQGSRLHLDFFTI